MATVAVDWASGAPRLSPRWLGTVVLAHAGLLAALLNTPATPESISAPRPLTVNLIEPVSETPKPVPTPRRPEPAVTPKPLPALAAPRPVAVPQAAPEAPTQEPQPAAVPEPLPSHALAEAPAPAPTPLTPPRAADYLANPRPPYPSLSRRQREEGTVRLSILVNADGSVARLELAQSSGYPRLDRSAMETVQSRWTFEPARQGDRPVAAWVVVPIQFSLRS